MGGLAVQANPAALEQPADRVGMDTGCAHCGEALPPGAAELMIDGERQAFCCDGCAAAARWIRDSDLGDYYRLRSAPSARVGVDDIDFGAWDRADVQAEHAQAITLDGGHSGREITVLTDGMRCAACAWLIDRALAREPGVESAAANAVTGRIRLSWDPQRTTLSAILRRLLALGYRPFLGSGEAQERERRRERNRSLIRLGVAGLGSMQAMMLSEALYLDFSGSMALPTRDFFRWLALLLSTPVVFYAGWPFIAGMLREWRARTPGMDTLVASAVLLAYGASFIETLRGGPHVWFDAAVMFVFLLLSARFIEQGARQRAGAHIDALARARPALASRIEGDGRLVQVPVSALQAGDRVRVAAGDTVPTDGVLEDAASFDEALLTGEPRAVAHLGGDAILAGSVCLGTPATLTVERTGSATWLSHLVRLVERAQGERPRVAQLAERIASRFVVGLFVCALLVGAAWMVVDPSRALEVTLAVLVVSCPCALSLAVPAALSAAHGALARLGVLAANANALDVLARADTLLLDKTGTLTRGRPQVTAVEFEAHPAHPAAAHEPRGSAAHGCGSESYSRQASPSRVRLAPTSSAELTAGRAMAIAAALERDSGHPLARGFVAAATAVVADAPADSAASAVASDALLATAVQTVTGAGVEGVVDGVHYRLGRPGYAAPGADDGRIWLGDGNRVLARFTLEDAPREDAAAAVAALQALGLRCEVLSGDEHAAVTRLAASLGIADARGRQSPDAKLARLRELQQQGHVVAMLGDGINDAPVLGGADVSLALAGGAPLAHRAADLVITGEALLRVPQALRLARRTRRIVRQNLGWALGYNLVALPFAALGLVAPWLAALGMAVSSLLVTLNALRVGRAPIGQRSDRRADAADTPAAAPVGAQARMSS